MRNQLNLNLFPTTLARNPSADLKKEISLKLKFLPPVGLMSTKAL
jgi:hypothetical protein